MKEKLFAWEREQRGLKVDNADLRGTLGWEASTDVRNYGCNDGIINDWSAICSLENWGEKYGTPQGLPDGDTDIGNGEFVTEEDAVLCGIDGSLYFDPSNFMQISGRGEFDWFFLKKHLTAKLDLKD